MKALNLLCVITLAILILLSSCGKDDPKPVSSPPTFLKVGARSSFYFNDGFFNVDSVIIEVKDQLAPDTFLIKNSSETIGVHPTQYWVINNNALYTSFRLRDKNAYILECKFGKPSGTKWTSTVGGNKYSFVIEGINKTVETGWGEVTDAIAVKRTVNGTSVTQFYSPTNGFLGTGSVDDPESVMNLHYYKPGSSNVTNKHIPPISFGNFNFLVVGKFWDYEQTDFFGNKTTTKLQIESKDAKNIFKVKLTANGSATYQYWYEDRGYLMVFDEGEGIAEADPIYIKSANAVLSDGWTGMTASGGIFLYTVENLSSSNSTYFGTLSCMEIYVSDGFFSTQINYWNANKGQVLISGLLTETRVTNSNARGKGIFPMIITP